MGSHLQFWFDRLPTPIGEMLVVADRHGSLRATFWPDDLHHPASDRPSHDPHSVERLRRFLQRHYHGMEIELQPARNPHGFTDVVARYFGGDLQGINSLPVETAGTPFQRQVWRALREIPCGTTVSYGQLAVRIGRPDAVRAVGTANGSNPVGVVVPCHRVIGANGSLTGYGGGLERKRWLLEHERQLRFTEL